MPRDGVIALRITNLDPGNVELASELTLERADGETWARVEDVRDLRMRDRCGETPAPCLTLVPGASLLPPPWLGMVGDAQCACNECGPAPAGRYRFVATTCSGVRVEGEPFEHVAR